MSEKPTPSRLPMARSTLGKRQLSSCNLTSAAKKQRQTSVENLSAVGRMGPPSSTVSRLSRQKSSSTLSTPLARPCVAPSSRTVSRQVVSSTSDGKSKRPAWDLKGRLEDMEKNMRQRDERWKENQSALDTLRNSISQLQQENIHLETTNKITDQEKTCFEQQLSQHQQQLREVKEANARLQSELESTQATNTSLALRNTSQKAELDAIVSQLSTVKASVHELTASESSLRQQLKASEQLNAELRERLTEYERRNEELNAECRQQESVRRHLHNTVQELKGNIRVFCRLRPLLGEELAESATTAVTAINSSTLELQQTVSGDGKKTSAKLVEPLSFTFDRVFSPSCHQEQVFEEISHLIQSAIDGYNVCVFAYGQTGSGKTFTMEGGRTESQAGMIPRSVHKIFQCVQQLDQKGWKYSMEATFVEIYNETLRDLLNTEKNAKTCEIRMLDNKSKEVYVTNLQSVVIESEEDISQLMAKARQQRSVAATKCNERSSRSHSVFTLKLIGSNSILNETCQGSLNLVDLAGSERVKESGSEGDRLTEAKNINKSLSNLGNVIMALAQKQEHVPYRNSKLTHLLQHSLGGNSKTLMFVNVSPRFDCLSETTNSLRFAVKVNRCHIGTAKKRL